MGSPLSTEDVASALGVTTQWVCHLVRMGKLSALRGKRRRYLFDPREVASFKRKYPSDVNPQPLK